MPNMDDFTGGVVKKELHVFYVLDTSGSMTGAPIAALNDAMRDTVQELASISRSSADAVLKIAVMEYNDDCKWVTLGENGLEYVEDFIWNDLQPRGMTNLGNALRELNAQLSRNAMMKSHTGNKIPVIIFMSDGYPNDNIWEQELSTLSGNKWFQSSIKIAFALGDGADENVLEKVVGDSKAVIKTSNLEKFKSMIRIVSATASLAASTSRTSNANVTGGDIISRIESDGDDDPWGDIYSSQDPADFGDIDFGNMDDFD